MKYFFKRFFEKDRDIRDLKGINICAIGTKTAAEVNTNGIKVDLVPDEFRAEGLVELFEKFQGSKGKGLKGLRFLFPRAEKAREIFRDRVRELGGESDVPVAYGAI